MNQASPIASSVGSTRILPLLFLLFAGSGCAALIYEIVWFQLLQLVIGSSAVSLGVLLATFMGGMCLGSILLPRLLSPDRHPLRVYAVIEVGIGVIGLAVLFAMPYVSHLYIEWGPGDSSLRHGLGGIILRGAVCGLCLLAPTILMGATLPAIARWVESTPQGVSWLGLFYGGNIAGAVLGCLLAGFYLLRLYDMALATYVAAALNATVALAAVGLAAISPYFATSGDRVPGVGDRVSGTGGKNDAHPSPSPTPDPPSPNPIARWVVYLAIALSGASALAAEVIWTRLLSLLLGATVYTFSIILAVFLIGLGLGSSVGSLLARSGVRPRLALGWCQLLLTAAIAWTAAIIAKSLPYWPINPYLSTSPWVTFQLDLVRCFWAILPAACLWGASFPLALASVAAPGQDTGRLVGGVYAANTIGAIFGALLSSLLVIPLLGTQQSQEIIILISGVAALLMLAPALWALGQRGVSMPGSINQGHHWPRSLLPAVRIGLFAALIIVPAYFGWTVSKVPWELVAFGRAINSYRDQWNIIYVGEGMNSSVAVTWEASGIRNFHVSGKVEASTDATDMRLQRMLGHIPALMHSKPRSVLVVGCGAGVTAGSFVPFPDVERIVICEIEPLIPEVVSTFFFEENYNVVQDPRVEIVYDDARHYILTTKEKFDIITSDPIHPWVKGSATLYTKEYFELCKQHLNPGGLITQWVPLYETTENVVKSEVATFFEAFPNGTIWANNKNGQGYDIVLLGSLEPITINADELQIRLAHPDFTAVNKSLEQVGFGGTVALFKTYAGRAVELQPWLENAEINRDRNLRLQYLAGMGLNVEQSNLIYGEILKYRKFPDDLFVGTGMRNTALRWAIQNQGSMN
jgi:spermidine synthase